VKPRPELFRTNPAFRRLFASRAISFIGDGAALVALLLYVKETRRSGTAVAGLLLAASLPRALGPLAGALADRFDRRTIMIVCDIGQAAAYTTIAATLPPWPVLLALVAITGLLSTTFGPASRSSIPGFFPRRTCPRRTHGCSRLSTSRWPSDRSSAGSYSTRSGCGARSG
jgi:MFS family permease